MPARKCVFFFGKASLRPNIDMEQSSIAGDLDDDKYEIGNDNLIDRRARDYDDDDELSLFGSLLPEWWKLLRNWQDLQVRSKQCDSIGDSDQDDDDDDDGCDDDGHDGGCGGGFLASQVKTVRQHWPIRITRVVALPKSASQMISLSCQNGLLDFVLARVMVSIGQSLI